MRALQVGKYSNTIQDLVLPWSYKAGSGIIPTPAKEFFNEKLPPNAQLPVRGVDQEVPAEEPRPTSPGTSRSARPTPRRLQQQLVRGEAGREGDHARSRSGCARPGTIRLTQMAAYDKHGNVMPVKFHLSLYDNNAVASDSMPQFPGLACRRAWLSRTTWRPADRRRKWPAR